MPDIADAASLRARVLCRRQTGGNRFAEPTLRLALIVDKEANHVKCRLIFAVRSLLKAQAADCHLQIYVNVGFVGWQVAVLERAVEINIAPR